MNQKLILYNGLKTILEGVTVNRADTGLPMTFRKVEMWANQLDKMHEDNAFLCPAAFPEFLTSNYMELSNGLQSYDLTVRLHLIFESYKDVDVEIWTLADATYRAVQGKQFGYFAKMKRREETQNFDHDMVQDYMIDFDCGKAKEYPNNNLVEAEITTLTVIPDIKIIVE